MSNIFTTGAMDVRQPDGSFKPTHVLIGNTKESIDAVNAEKQKALTEIDRVKKTIPADYTQLNTDVGGLREHLTSLENAEEGTITGRLSESVAEIGGMSLSALKQYECYITNSNVWEYSSAAKCVVIPADGNKEISIKQVDTSKTIHVAFLSDFVTPVNGAHPTFCNGKSGRIVVGGEYNDNIPSDCKYIYLLTFNNVKYVPTSVVIDGIYDVTKSLTYNIIHIEEEKRIDIDMQMDNRFHKKTVIPDLTNGYIDYITGKESSYSPNGTFKKTDFIRVPYNCEKIQVSSGFNGNAGIAFFNKRKEFISGENANKEKVLLDDSEVAYVRFSAYSADADFSNVSIAFYGLLAEDVSKIEDILRSKSDKTYVFSDINVAIPLDGVWNFNTGVVFQPQNTAYKHAIIENRGFEKIKIRGHHYTNSEYNGYGFYDEYMRLLYARKSDRNENFEQELAVPQDCKYIYINGNNSSAVPAAYLISDVVDVNSLKADVDSFESKERVMAEAPTERGYISWKDGVYHNYDAGTGTGENPKRYACNTQYLEIDTYRDYYYDGSLDGSDSGIAFYDSNKVYVGGTNAQSATIRLDIPKNAKYLRYSEVDRTSTGTFKGILREVVIGRIEKEVSKYANQIIICCTGDSVTEGMATDGAHTADYGKSPYPARLFTILKDKGYNNVTVINQGHGGERTPDIAVRLGAFPCYFAENVTIPSNNAQTSLGTMTAVQGRATGTKVKIPYADADGDDYCVYFTQTSHDTNPVLIDGVEYNLSISGNTNYIQKVANDGKETVIPAGAFLLTNDNKNPNVNIFYGGINDGGSLTLKRWVDTMKACANANGGKYIVLGSTHPLFANWSDLTGTLAEKYAKYRRTCMEEFGVHFIDLYDEFARHALDYALSAGYYTDKSESELATMREKLSNHIIPKEMCYDKASENNVHLSEEGYHVIGMLLFWRLKILNYI